MKWLLIASVLIFAQSASATSPLNVTLPIERMNAIAALYNEINTRSAVLAEAQENSNFFKSTQPKFSELLSEAKMEDPSIEAKFRTDRFGWTDAQRSFHARLVRVLAEERWVEQNWGPAYGKPILVMHFLAGREGSFEALTQHYQTTQRRIESLWNFVSNRTFKFVGSLPLTLYTPIKYSVFIFSEDANAVTPLPVTAWPIPTLDGKSEVYGRAAGEAVVVRSLSPADQSRLDALNRTLNGLWVSSYRMDVLSCVERRRVAFEEYSKIQQRILERSDFFRLNKKGPRIVQNLGNIRLGLQTANTWRQSTARLQSLLDVLSQVQFSQTMSLEDWWNAILNRMQHLPQSLKEEAQGLQYVLLAAVSLGEFSAQLNANGELAYQELMVGFRSTLTLILNKAYNENNVPKELTFRLTDEMRLAEAQLDFEVKRLKALDDSEAMLLNDKLTDQVLDQQMLALYPIVNAALGPCTTSGFVRNEPPGPSRPVTSTMDNIPDLRGGAR
jgi:hypothetical protein